MIKNIYIKSMICFFIFIVSTVLQNNIKSSELTTSQKIIPQSIKYKVDPKNFSLYFFDEENKYLVSKEQEIKKFKNFKQNNNNASWDYPEQNLSVVLEDKGDYISVDMTSHINENSISFPSICAEEYYLPLGEGKRIPSRDKIWQKYLTSMDFPIIEQFSMPFFATKIGKKSIVYILENSMRSDLKFDIHEKLDFKVLNKYSKPQKVKRITYRIYLTDNDPNKIANIYKSYIKEKGSFVTLKEKSSTNNNIEKLYGAPFIYLFNTRLITPDNVNWSEYVIQRNSTGMKKLLKRAENLEGYPEFKEIMNSLEEHSIIDSYQQNIICSILSELLKIADEFQNPLEQIKENKKELKQSLPTVFNSVDSWASSATTDIIQDMKTSGIDKAWIGLDNWDTAYANPNIISKGKKLGYLIATYDSYHSIHEKGKEQWNTAAFEDETLYERGTVSNINGEKIPGFNNVGRKLNPLFSFDEVQNRTGRLIGNGLSFNSWFIDTDATGEVYDDYSLDHLTSKEEDIEARLKRMSYIRDTKNMVIGSEGGNDFASPVISFAHGLELPPFSWLDKDMKDENSEYFIGKYYSTTGGVPDNFGKQIPVKNYLKHLFLDINFDVPLYKLVYNNSVISSYHWDWSTLKIKGEIENRMLREVTYNIPPMYHLDAKNWEKWKSTIVVHHKIWSAFNKKAIQHDMTDFSYVNGNYFLQKTAFGPNLSTVTNFSEQDIVYEGETIPRKSVLIIDSGTHFIYTPNN